MTVEPSSVAAARRIVRALAVDEVHRPSPLEPTDPLAWANLEQAVAELVADPAAMGATLSLAAVMIAQLARLDAVKLARLNDYDADEAFITETAGCTISIVIDGLIGP